MSRPKQRQINESILQCYIIEEGQEEVVFNIFKRINTGGLILSPQEIRHVMHQDVAEYLKRLAESEEFKAATANKISSRRMLDRDFVNRFLAFYLLDYKNDFAYEGDLDSLMNQALDKLEKTA